MENEKQRNPYDDFKDEMLNAFSYRLDSYEVHEQYRLLKNAAQRYVSKDDLNNYSMLSLVGLVRYQNVPHGGVDDGDSFTYELTEKGKEVYRNIESKLEAQMKMYLEEQNKRKQDVLFDFLTNAAFRAIEKAREEER